MAILEDASERLTRTQPPTDPGADTVLLNQTEWKDESSRRNLFCYEALTRKFHRPHIARYEYDVY